MGIVKKQLLLQQFPQDTDFLLKCVEILPIFRFYAYSKNKSDITFVRADAFCMISIFFLVLRNVNLMELL